VTERLSIKGGAGPMEAAAIIAAVMHLLDSESAERAQPPVPSSAPAWVRMARPAPFSRFVAPIVPDPGQNET
jgi:hypothetical protein